MVVLKSDETFICRECDTVLDTSMRAKRREERSENVCRRCESFRKLSFRSRIVKPCKSDCRCVDLEYAHTSNGVDIFELRGCKRRCCRETLHNDINPVHFCAKHRDAMKRRLEHRTWYRVDENGKRVEHVPSREAYFGAGGALTRSPTAAKRNGTSKRISTTEENENAMGY